MTVITFEGKPATRVDFHVVGKMLWAKVTFEDGRMLDVEVQKSDGKGIMEIGKKETE